MASSEQTSNRLNLHFDELDRDVLEWLNSFGKGKRARVAKAALRRVMNEGVSIPELLNVAESSRWFSSSLPRPPGPKKDVVNATSTFPDIDIVSVRDLLELTGTEDSPEVLELLRD